jgi:acyl dehydratase
MIDPKWRGYRFPKTTCEVEKGRVRAFARAIGDTRPECHDEAAARAAGYASLLAPPTFPFTLNPDQAGTLATLGVGFDRLLHGEQSFTYDRPIVAGDVLTLELQVADIAVKKNGAMELLTLDTTFANERNERVASMRQVCVILHS